MKHSKKNKHFKKFNIPKIVSNIDKGIIIGTLKK
ncbi:hypothetical protein LCGC14_0224560 [marine sediment metagenome]|uniref:Uncharacterized protein n=1 Tax=marine sediment metagenome TaxID=412755 RepID=A0A0F9UTS6_9ZZZZ